MAEIRRETLRRLRNRAALAGPGRACASLSSPRLGTGPSLSSLSLSLLRSKARGVPSVASLFGRENCHGHFSFLGLTPVGSTPTSRGWQRSQIKLLGMVWAGGVYGSEQPGIASMDKPDKIA